MHHLLGQEPLLQHITTADCITKPISTLRVFTLGALLSGLYCERKSCKHSTQNHFHFTFFSFALYKFRKVTRCDAITLVLYKFRNMMRYDAIYNIICHCLSYSDASKSSSQQHIASR